MTIRGATGTTTLAAAAFAAAIVPGAPEALAQASSCQTEFRNVMEPRQALINRINGFRTKRPTPGQACLTLGQLVAAESEVMAWMNENKDWCQIPDETIGQVRRASGQFAPGELLHQAPQARGVRMTLSHHRRLIRQWEAFFRNWDVVLCPPEPVPAKLGEHPGRLPAAAHPLTMGPEPARPPDFRRDSAMTPHSRA